MKNNLLENKNALIFCTKGATGITVSKVLKEFGVTIYMSDINVDGIAEESKLGQVGI